MRFLTLVCCLLSADIKPLPKDRSEDSYAVYSAVLQSPSLSHPNGNVKYLIEDRTGLGSDSPRGCVRPPSEYAQKLEEILDEYSRLKDERYSLERNFTIEKPYELLNEADAKRFSDERVVGIREGQTAIERFRGAIDLITLGNVYFDRGRTVALVRTGAWCGGLCGLWIWRAFVKEDGNWQERKWSNCIAVADVQGVGVPTTSTRVEVASMAMSK